jgi:uncharacterized protein (TIGR01777 family)
MCYHSIKNNQQMHVLITGGSGLVGSYLTPHFLSQNYEVTILSRSARTSGHNKQHFVRWDGKNIPSEVENVDILINLAGAGVLDDRWTDAYKRQILESRINSTTACVKFIQDTPTKPQLFISASAVGYYGTKQTTPLDESASAGKDFLGITCQKWEDASKNAGIRTVIPRIGLVLAAKGGAFPRLLKPFKYYAGGYLGDGKQGFPWIHIDDVVAIFQFFINHPDTEGVFNLTAPEQLTNKDFSKIIGKLVGKPAAISVPAFVVKTMLGESSAMLLEGQFVTPKRLLEAGYSFKYPQAEAAVRDLLKMVEM